MSLRRFTLPVLALCLGLGSVGCETTGGINAAQRSQARRIGVLSAMGDRIHARTESAPLAGGAIFAVASAFTVKNHRDTAPDFQIDATANAAATQSLRNANPGVQVLALQAERGSVQPPAGDEALQAAARTLGAEHSLDLVVLVVPRSQFIKKNSAMPGEGGYGYGSVSSLGVQGKDMFVYANYAVGVFNGKTGQQIALRSKSVDYKLKGIRWRGPLDRYTTGERQQIGEALRLLIGEEVFRQLRELGLSS